MPAGSMTAVVPQPSKKGLRFAAGSDYALGVPATVGIKVITLGKKALPRHHCEIGAFFAFVVPQWRGCAKQPSGWPVPSSGCDDFVQSATTLSSPGVGGLQSKEGVRIMAISQTSALFPTQDTKCCAKCGKEKPLSAFSKDSANKDGLQRRCKNCNSQLFSDWRKKNIDVVRKKAVITQQIYRVKHRDKWLAQKKAYYLATKDRVKTRIYDKEKRSAYLAKNKDKVRKSQAVYRENNKEKTKERRIAWETANPEKVSANKRNRRARKRNAEGSHTAADIRQLLLLQKSKCAVCRASIAKGYHVDHVIPLALNGGNGKDNLQLLCPPCNLSKNAQHPVDFMQSRGMLL